MSVLEGKLECQICGSVACAHHAELVVNLESDNDTLRAEVERLNRVASALEKTISDLVDRNRVLREETEHSNMTRVVLREDDVEWVVNNLAELGVKVMGRYFFCYKGLSIEYTSDNNHNDHERPMKVRRVFKREFGECVHPPELERLTVSYDEKMPGGWELLPQPCRTKKEE